MIQDKVKVTPNVCMNYNTVCCMFLSKDQSSLLQFGLNYHAFAIITLVIITLYQLKLLLKCGNAAVKLSPKAQKL